MCVHLWLAAGGWIEGEVNRTALVNWNWGWQYLIDWSKAIYWKSFRFVWTSLRLLQRGRLTPHIYWFSARRPTTMTTLSTAGQWQEQVAEDVNDELLFVCCSQWMKYPYYWHLLAWSRNLTSWICSIASSTYWYWIVLNGWCTFSSSAASSIWAGSEQRSASEVRNILQPRRGRSKAREECSAFREEWLKRNKNTNDDGIRKSHLLCNYPVKEWIVKNQFARRARTDYDKSSSD